MSKFTLLVVIYLMGIATMFAQQKLINIPLKKKVHNAPIHLNINNLNDNSAFYGVLLSNISKTIQGSRTTYYIVLPQHEIFRFVVHIEKTNGASFVYLRYASDSILMNKPGESIGFLGTDTLFDKILDTYKPKLLIKLAGKDSLAVNLAPLSELDIVPKLVKIYDNSDRSIDPTAFFKINYLKAQGDNRFIRIAIPGYPSLVYCVDSLPKSNFSLSLQDYKNYLLHYCFNNQIVDDKARPTVIEEKANEIFGVSLTQAAYREIAYSLHYSPLYRLVKVSIIIFFGLFLLIIVFFGLYIKKQRNDTNKNRKESESQIAVSASDKGVFALINKMEYKQSINLKKIDDNQRYIIEQLKTTSLDNKPKNNMAISEEKLKDTQQSIENFESKIANKIDTRIATIEQLFYELNNKLDRMGK